jgi:hypothetical protein
MKNVGWTWAVTIVGYVIYSMYIVIFSLKKNSGLIMCVVFYGQMSIFASVSLSSFTSAETQLSSVSIWFARVTQFESITSLSSQTCYGANMGAFAVTAMQLSGPAIVLVSSVAFTLGLKLEKVQPFLQRHKIVVSIPATLSVVILLIFSSLTTVVFKLITCTTITNDSKDEHVVFIDGTVKCYDEKWGGLIAVVVLLCLFPIVFLVVLSLPLMNATENSTYFDSVRMACCSAYLEPRFYWGAVTLFFRLVMSITYATIRDFPSTAALIHTFLCSTMLVVLMYQKPYRHTPTFHFDVLCYLSLIMQFALEVLVRDSDSLGVSLNESNPFFFTLRRVANLSVALRYVSKRSLLCCYFAFFLMHIYKCRLTSRAL